MSATSEQTDETISLTEIVSKETIKQLTMVTDDIRQVNTLLHEAVSELSSRFANIQAIIDEIKATQEGNNGQSYALSQMQNQIHGIITALQFEDLTRQINDKSILRLQSFENVLHEIVTPRSLKKEALAISQAEAFMTLCTSMNETMSVSVHQTHLQSGDVELF